MNVVSQRLVRLGLAAVAVLGLTLSACGEPTGSSPSGPATAPTGASSSSTAPGGPGAQDLAVPDDAAGCDGLTVRYLGDDGTVKSVEVQDFPR
jgi:hypothetical protein